MSSRLATLLQIFWRNLRCSAMFCDASRSSESQENGSFHRIVWQGLYSPAQAFHVTDNNKLVSKGHCHHVTSLIWGRGGCNAGKVRGEICLRYVTFMLGFTLRMLIHIDPNPAISARAVFPQSGHIPPEDGRFPNKIHIFPK